MQVLSTNAVPSHEAFSYWRDVLAQHFVHLRPERVSLDPFLSTIEAQQLEGYSFSQIHAAPQRVYRARQEIARSPYDLIFLNVHLRGEGSYCQGADEVALNACDLFILDAVRPFELGCEGGVTQISIKIPRQALWERMRRPERACGTRICSTSHIGKLLSGYIRTLWRQGEGEQKPGYHRAVDHLLSIVAYEVDRRYGDSALPRKAVRAAIYACAVAHIDEAYGMPRLTPRKVAHAVATSLRTLQDIFAERGDAISRHIQNRRITTVARWLADPAMRGQPIGELAFMAGFCELSHFTHAFVRAYKETPGNWRRRHLGK
jgi:AraC family transcriptional regulator, positive regulator of tynA and feaB